MSDVVRVYCQSEEPPSLQEILDWLIQEEIGAAFDEATAGSETDQREWDAGVIVLVGTQAAVELECYRSEGSHAMDFQRLCRSFERRFSELENVGESDPVREHLATTNYIVVLQALADGDGGAAEVVELISQSLASNEEGIIEHEDQGFFDADGELLLEFD